MKFIEIEREIVFVPRAWEEETELLFNESRLSNLQNEKIFGGYSAIWMLLIPLNHTFRNHQEGKFYSLCVF